MIKAGASRILTLSESWMSVPATLQDFRPEKDLSLLGVPNRMATIATLRSRLGSLTLRIYARSAHR